MFVWFFYVMNMFNLRLTDPLVEISLKYTILAFTILKKLTFPRRGVIFINLVDSVTTYIYANVKIQTTNYLFPTKQRHKQREKQINQKIKFSLVGKWHFWDFFFVSFAQHQLRFAVWCGYFPISVLFSPSFLLVQKAGHLCKGGQGGTGKCYVSY